MSALPRASNAEPVPPTASTGPIPAGENGSTAVPVLIPGSWRTYENREVLRGLGLRWDPSTHAWHGALSARARVVLRERFGLAVRPVVALESFPAQTGTESPSVPPAPPKPPRGPSPTRRSLVHDYSRSRLESRLAIRDTADDLADPWQPILGSRFSLLDVTSGLPDDFREVDERHAERHLCDLRGRVKRARAVIASSPGLAEILASNPRRAAMFNARFGVTEEQVRSCAQGDSQPECHEDFVHGPAVEDYLFP